MPQDAIEVGDAIELAAAESAGGPDVTTWLGLNLVKVEMSPAPEKDTADTNESIAKPAGMFSKAFVENSGPPLALIANEPDWADLGDFVKLFESLPLGGASETGPPLVHLHRMGRAPTDGERKRHH